MINVLRSLRTSSKMLDILKITMRPLFRKIYIFTQLMMLARQYAVHLYKSFEYSTLIFKNCVTIKKYAGSSGKT